MGKGHGVSGGAGRAPAACDMAVGGRYPLAAFFGALAGLLAVWLLAGSALVGAATLFGVLWYAPRYAGSLHGSCDAQAVRAEKGVFWTQKLFIPVSSLRTVESWATPLHRLCRCRTIVLRFAGGAAFLPFLPEEQAERLTALLEKLAAEE